MKKYKLIAILDLIAIINLIRFIASWRLIGLIYSATILITVIMRLLIFSKQKEQIISLIKQI